MSSSQISGATASGEGRLYWVATDLVDIKVDGSQSNEAFAVIETTVLPGCGPPMHVHHREHESFFVLEGEIEFTVAGQVSTAGQGALVHGKPGIPHRFENKASTPAKMLIHICPAGLERFFMEVGTPVTDRGTGPPQPDIAKMLELATQYGLEFPR